MTKTYRIESYSNDEGWTSYYLGGSDEDNLFATEAEALFDLALQRCGALGPRSTMTLDEYANNEEDAEETREYYGKAVEAARAGDLERCQFFLCQAARTVEGL